MLSDLNLNINNIGPIHNANIKIGKINVIGGLNATGKSTASKILYCFLKGGINNRQEFAYSLIEPILYRTIRMAERVNFESFLNDDETFEVLGPNENLLDQYISIRKEVLSSNNSNFADNSLYSRMEGLDKQIEVIEENSDRLYSSLFRQQIRAEFYTHNLKGLALFEGKFNNDYFKFSFKSAPRFKLSNSGFFLINDVIYVDSFSIFDFIRIRRNDHISHLKDYIFDSEDVSDEFLDDELNERIILVEDKINVILQGKFGHGKTGRLSFVDGKGNETPIKDTSSGMKQIGVIQMLLASRKLKENSFLIIDEPEVNLHPEWQIKLAEIFVLLASQLNIFVYINSHSPMFIEAISIFSEYYNLQDETNFYLTEKVDDDNGYYFKEIAYDNMGEVYENLAKPYMELDQFKAKIAHNKLGD